MTWFQTEERISNAERLASDARQTTREVREDLDRFAVHLVRLTQAVYRYLERPTGNNREALAKVIGWDDQSKRPHLQALCESVDRSDAAIERIGP